MGNQKVNQIDEVKPFTGKFKAAENGGAIESIDSIAKFVGVQPSIEGTKCLLTMIGEPTQTKKGYQVAKFANQKGETKVMGLNIFGLPLDNEGFIDSKNWKGFTFNLFEGEKNGVKFSIPSIKPIV